MRLKRKLHELEEVFKKSKIQILGLSEVRRPFETLLTTKNNNILFHSYSKGGQKGIGYIIKQELKDSITEIEAISDHIGKLVLELSTNERLVIVQVYAPRSNATEDEIENFYKELEKTIDTYTYKRKHQLTIMGDFNSQVGQKRNREHKYLGNYCYGQCNEKGQRLLDFCQEH